MSKAPFIATMALTALLLAGACDRAEAPAAPTPSPAPQQEQAPVLNEEDVPLATVFYGWYGFDEGGCKGGRHSSHWSAWGDGLGTVYRPAVGFYCSADESTIAWQVKRMRQAGISVVLYSWWGWGDANLDGESDNEILAHFSKTLLTLLEYLQTHSMPMKVAVVIEPFPATAGLDQFALSSSQKRMVLDWLWENVYTQYPDLMTAWEGKPLLVTFEFILDDVGDDRWTFRRWAGRPLGEVRAEGWHWSNNPVEPPEERISDDGVLFVLHRFDQWYWWVRGGPILGVTEPIRKDPTLEERWYEEQWETAVENRERLSMIVVFAWNEYNEQAIIEPSFGGPAPVGYDYVEKTRRYYQRFLQGEPPSLPATAERVPDTPTATLPDRRDPPLGTLWYPVYGYGRETGECEGGLGSAGWNEGLHSPPVLVEPDAGYYCFGDPGYRRHTIDLMQRYGFSWVMVSWNGWGDVDLDGDVEAEDFQGAHGDIRKTFGYLEEQLDGEFKAVLLVEPFMQLGGLDPSALTPQQRQKILDEAWRVYSEHPAAVLHWEGRPLLVQWYPVDLGKDRRFTIRTFGSSPDPEAEQLDWNWYPDPEKYPEMVAEDGFMAFAPRFDEYFMWIMGTKDGRPRRMDPYLRDGVYRRLWGVASENAGEVKLLLIYAWNAYAEQAFLEPAVNGPLGSGGERGLGLLEDTRRFYADFLSRLR